MHNKCLICGRPTKRALAGPACQRFLSTMPGIIGSEETPHFLYKKFDDDAAFVADVSAVDGMPAPSVRDRIDDVARMLGVKRIILRDTDGSLWFWDGAWSRIRKDNKRVIDMNESIRIVQGE